MAEAELSKEGVTVVEVGDRKLPCEERVNLPDVVEEKSTGATAAIFAGNDTSSSRVTPKCFTVQIGITTGLSFR